ncbi:MAG: amidinotransferase [Dysgonamonadaceae bacterium]|jgi:hypothetical protein|nr:amidinotransferase [Dysgonamonadaceae bacterium]
MQTTLKILMVRPARFAYNKETAKNNLFQQKIDASDIDRLARDEFDAFANLLRRNDVDLTVVNDTPDPWTPDSIFPNNWFSSHISGELVLYPMFAENRRLERKRDVINLLLRQMRHTKLIDLTKWEQQNEFLEGTGSMVLDRDKRVAYCCRSARTSEKVLADFCSQMNFDAVVFDAMDSQNQPIYHTNVMMFIGTQIAVVCLESIKNEKERGKVLSSLRSAGKITVDISLSQVSRFAGNMLEIKNRNGNPLTVMSASARNALTSEQENIISSYSKILSPDLSTIETVGGGSARCMMAEIFV